MKPKSNKLTLVLAIILALVFVPLAGLATYGKILYPEELQPTCDVNLPGGGCYMCENAGGYCNYALNYIRDDLGVLMLVNCLIKNTTPPGKGGGDPFWEKSETALLQALIFYLIKYRPKAEQNFTNVMKLLRAAEVDENNPNAKSKLDRLFDEVARNDPNSIALKQYTTFKM